MTFPIHIYILPKISKISTLAAIMSMPLTTRVVVATFPLYPNFWVLNPMVIAIKIAPSPGISQSSNRIIPSISNIPRKHPHQKPPCLLVTVTTIYCSHLFKPQANHVGRLSHCRCTLNSHWHSIRRPRRSRSRKGSQGVWIRSESGVRGGSSYLES